MKIKLTDELSRTICAYIRAGAFPHVAAEAAGVPAELFEVWMHMAETSRGQAKNRYAKFRVIVLQARAQARLAAEMAVLKDKPADWLRNGPGKEADPSKGWTQPIRAKFEDKRQVSIHLHPELSNLFAAVLEVLAPFPEARQAVAGALTAIKQD
jgi:hypothetical protein